MSGATASLIVELQPMLTAVLALWLLAERSSLTLWAGLILGLMGTVLVVVFDAGQVGGMSAIAIVLALVGIAVGSVYQKKFVQAFDWRAGAVWQFAGSLVVTVPFAALFEQRMPSLNAEYLFWLGWRLILGVAAVALLNTLPQRQSAINVAGLST